ncbi:Kinase-like protein [Mycena venus]|uniref:non-specific serine/threonine protein kinase n=1 Tax=Mycena venus TaxID=2733690 RepID=A0A8H7CII9_9AGAR|nr:Kinase-like protein [Mycena venus]
MFLVFAFLSFLNSFKSSTKTPFLLPTPTTPLFLLPSRVIQVGCLDDEYQRRLVFWMVANVLPVIGCILFHSKLIETSKRFVTAVAAAVGSVLHSRLWRSLTGIKTASRAVSTFIVIIVRRVPRPLHYLLARITTALSVVSTAIQGLIFITHSRCASLLDVLTEDTSDLLSSGFNQRRHLPVRERGADLATVNEWIVFGGRFIPSGFDVPLPVNPAAFRWRGTLGAGAFGSVFKVWDVVNKNHFAVKRLDKASNHEDNFSTEILAHQLVHHQPGFPRLFGAFEDQQNYYMVMECGKASFHDVKVLSKEQIRFYSGELLLRLHALHGYGIIHRDVKPENLLLSQTGHLLLADFGIARLNFALEEEEPDPKVFPEWEEARQDGGDAFPFLWSTDDENPHVVATEGCGTEGYMAPEVESGWPYSYGADYWGLGQVVWRWASAAKQQYDPEEKAIAVDFLKNVLAPVEEHRLTVSEMKEHAFFAGLDFVKLKAGLIPVPRGPPASL